MSIKDKITGRAKQAAGDLADDESLHREGRQEERKGEAKEELADAHAKADAKAEEVANLERKTS
jgi:uncharacterized protein YjbJ (UPF0337 family)